MSGHTVIVFDAARSLTTCQQFTNLLRLPVRAFYSSDEHDMEESDSEVPEGRSEVVARSLHDLAELVGSATFPKGPTAEERDAWGPNTSSRYSAVRCGGREGNRCERCIAHARDRRVVSQFELGLHNDSVTRYAVVLVWRFHRQGFHAPLGA
jgi:hypothetical protein